MKPVLLPILLVMILAVYVASCNKEDDSLGKKLEGEWKIKSYLYNGTELYNLDSGAFSIAFDYYYANRGTTEWKKIAYPDLLSLIDTSSGNFTINAGQNAIHIKWSNPAFWGGYESATFEVLHLSEDTLMFDEEIPGVVHRNITAVRY
ncbi:MAG: lipocalin family protein [Saprospiraceae bacterium]|nr:lipocalin family protein [Saprospiraceae bacterium]MCB9306901.1 lipocalin family protein [Lewinellaceae bacterium]MCB9354327.1 lipocalin family protein [Lewinellaceae bacterium]